jgi:hypothetical protein
MSVILEALQKARSDRKIKAATESATARVLEPQVNGPVMVTSASGRAGVEGARAGSGRTWVLAVAVIMSLVLLLCLIGGMFWLLYDQVRRVNTVATSPASTTAVAPVVAGPTGALPGAVPLPTPLPVQELPVEPPAPAAAAAGDAAVIVEEAKPAAAATASPAAAEFVLGSIVCEAGDCLASLNGRSVRVGDVVKGWTVIEISTSALVLQNASGEQRSLSLFD